MLTRDTALARLRANGTLESGVRQPNAIEPTQLTNPATKAIAALISANKQRAGHRLLAPSQFQGILP